MNVLLPIDESSCSEAAVDAVLNQFRPEHTFVRVLHVVEWPHRLSATLTFAEGPTAADCVLAAHEDIRRRGSALVNRAATRLQDAQFQATAFVVEGEAKHAILEMAAEWPADTIVIGSHGRTGLDRVLLGSVSAGVMRQATCSVQIVREPTPPIRDQFLPAAS
jgi:nucleotide-binding universal stress UspA family protein